ncbi:hypothetical protein C8R48DRAFT_781363 [Suillus tomentosus]|nr:hypothetical protein C8R48DRAFT_781363 [Suillus tomentosus]
MSARIPAHRTSPDALQTSSGNLRTLFDSPQKLGARTRSLLLPGLSPWSSSLVPPPWPFSLLPGSLFPGSLLPGSLLPGPSSFLALLLGPPPWSSSLVLLPNLSFMVLSSLAPLPGPLLPGPPSWPPPS